ncbi:hypothetical protein [Shewanella fidelis]|uniref:hypothetical protein n=1 Tax=Shewanella fidelis TaxID=173509 RepID=UPI00048FCD73|nr:hypothetical protein [Shewanella fidelis]
MVGKSLCFLSVSVVVGILVDCSLINFNDAISSLISKELFGYLLMAIGMLVLYVSMSFLFKLDFKKLVFGGMRDNKNDPFLVKLRYIPPTLMFVSFFTSGIPYFFIPFTFLAITEVGYLFFIRKKVNHKEI